MSIKGFKSQQALQQKIKGLTEDQSIDYARYATMQEMTGKRHALDTFNHGVYKVTLAPLTVEAGSNIRTIKATAHGAMANDMIRMSNGVEFGILSTPDADTIITTVELSGDPTGDTFDIYRTITPTYDSDGNVQVSIVPTAIAYNRKSGGVTTLTSALEDLDTPANSRAIPVVLHGLDSASITVTSQQLDISSSAANDSVRLGDGTRLTDVTVNNELKVKDTDNNTVLTNIQNKTNQLGTVSTLNSFSGTLGIGASWTGAGEDTKDIGNVAVGIYSSQVSAIDGFKVEVSPDNVSWYDSDTFTITANDVKFYTFCPSFRYFRLSYINDGIASTDVKIQTVLKPFHIKPSFHKLESALTDENDAELVRSVIAGHTTAGGGAYVNVKVNPSGALTTDTTLSPSIGTRIGTVAIDQTTDGTTNKVSVGNFPATQATAQADRTPDFAEILNLTNSMQTFIIPANAKWVNIQADDTNSVNIRCIQSGNATATSGHQLEPGRDKDFFSGGNITVIAESAVANQKVCASWAV